MEGGYFRRTYTSPGTVALERGLRRQGSAIYYLLEPGTFSEMHVLDSDEIFHFYLGDPAEMLQLWPDGRSARVTLGPELSNGHQVQLEMCIRDRARASLHTQCRPDGSTVHRDSQR